MSDQEQYGNRFERTVIGHEPIDPAVYPREVSRYQWAAAHFRPGMRVLELGCSSGYGTRLLPDGIVYTGVDTDHAIIEYARRHFPSQMFVCSTIDFFLDGLDKTGERFDAILAFEVLEHVLNGKELAQRLKHYAPLVLVTTPYREPVGFWGPHHVLHGLLPKDFPQFAYTYMHPDGSLHDAPTVEPANLLLMTWADGVTYPDPAPRVLCSIPTRDRPDMLLHCLHSVAMQTWSPDKVIVYDDGADKIDLRAHPIGRYVLPLLRSRGIEWEVAFIGPGVGQHIAHQLANESGYDLVWRLDDDQVPEPDVLARLLAHMTDGVGAVGGAVYEVDRQFPGATGKLDDVFLQQSTQWAANQGCFDVEVLHGSFLYRSGIVDYKHTMSPVAFHEETIFSHRLFRAGYRLIVDTSIHTHHFKAPHGGTRSLDYQWAYQWDADEFLKLAASEWGVKVIHLGVGLGDCLAFRNILPELSQRYSRIFLGCVYPEVFKDDPVTLIPYEAALAISRDNVYDFAGDRQWTGSLLDAYRELYA